MAMLRHIPTGDLYVYSAQLMKRGDMEFVEDTPPTPVTQKVRTRRAPTPPPAPVIVPPADFDEDAELAAILEAEHDQP